VTRCRIAPRAAAIAMLALTAACAPKTTAPVVPGAPKFPDFIYPAPAPSADARAAQQQQAAWQILQTGDARAAEKQFALLLKEQPAFYPAEAGLGYAALARKEYKEAAAHFDRALAGDTRYAPALVGRGEAMLAIGDRNAALVAFESALAANPQLTSLRGRIDSLRFRGVQDDIAAARKAAESGRWPEARRLYEQAIAASPDSPFLLRELAAVERREGDLPSALSHARRAAELEPAEPRTFILIGEIYEAQSDFTQALDAYAAAAALEPTDALNDRIEKLRERTAFAAMPAEYQSIESATTVTRAQLAALIGVQLEALLKTARMRSTVVMTDTRSNWAAPWILSVTRAGIMEAFPNHTFQPNAVVRRVDLATAASHALSLIATGKPRLEASWRNNRRKFPDVPPTHLSYPAVSMAVEAGVMSATDDGTFQMSRPVTGAEAVAAVRKLRELFESSR
jgi:tetratricopeptide (TPR) repeat protein